MSGYLYTLIALRDGQTLGWIVGGRKWLELSPNLPARACPQRITSPSRTPVSLCDVKVVFESEPAVDDPRGAGCQRVSFSLGAGWREMLPRTASWALGDRPPFDACAARRESRLTSDQC